MNKKFLIIGAAAGLLLILVARRFSKRQGGQNDVEAFDSAHKVTSHDGKHHSVEALRGASRATSYHQNKNDDDPSEGF